MELQNFIKFTIMEKRNQEVNTINIGLIVLDTPLEYGQN
jgi:hypothetical protein